MERTSQYVQMFWKYTKDWRCEEEIKPKIAVGKEEAFYSSMNLEEDIEEV